MQSSPSFRKTESSDLTNVIYLINNRSTFCNNTYALRLQMLIQFYDITLHSSREVYSEAKYFVKVLSDAYTY